MPKHICCSERNEHRALVGQCSSYCLWRSSLGSLWPQYICLEDQQHPCGWRCREPEAQLARVHPRHCGGQCHFCACRPLCYCLQSEHLRPTLPSAPVPTEGDSSPENKLTSEAWLLLLKSGSPGCWAAGTQQMQ